MIFMRALIVSLFLIISFFLTKQCVGLEPPDFTNYYTTLSLDKEFIRAVDAAILNRDLEQALNELEKKLDKNSLISIREALDAYKLKKWNEAATKLFIETEDEYESSLNKKKYIYKEIEKQIKKKVESFIKNTYQSIALKWHPDKLVNSKSGVDRLLGQTVFPKLAQASQLRNYDFRFRYSQHLKNVEDWGHDQVITDAASYQERQEVIRAAQDPRAAEFNQKEKEISDLFDSKDVSDVTYKNYIKSLIQAIQLLSQYFDSQPQQDLAAENENFFLRTVRVIKNASDFDFTSVNQAENNKFFKALYEIENITDENGFNNWLAQGKKPDDLKDILTGLYKQFKIHNAEPSLSEKIRKLHDMLAQLQNSLNQLSKKLNALRASL